MLASRGTRLLSFCLLSFLVVIAFQNCTSGFGTMSLDGVANFSSEGSSNYSRLSFNRGSALPNLFGYFADGMEGVGRGDYIDETTHSANIHFVNGDDLVVAAKVRKAASKGAKSVLMLEGHLFQWLSLVPQPDANQRVSRLVQTLKSQNLMDAVVGVYLIDEPYWKNRYSSKKLSDAEVYANLQSAARLIQGYFGNSVFVMSTEAYPEMDRAVTEGWLGFPPEVDLVAMNCYLAFQTACSSWSRYVQLLTILQNYLLPNQHMFLTMDDFWDSSAGANPQTQQALIERNRQQEAYAKQNGIRVLVPFLYQSQDTAPDIGLDRLPQLYAEIKRISRDHIGERQVPSVPPVVVEPPAQGQPPAPQPPAPPVQPAPPPATPQPRCDAEAQNLLCNVDGEISYISMTVGQSAAAGARSTAYIVPASYVATQMNVEWTCRSGRWDFSHSAGLCRLQRVCNPSIVNLTCTVQGAQQIRQVRVKATGRTGDITNSYEFLTPTSPQRMDVQWTCQKGQWIFSHPAGWCSL